MTLPDLQVLNPLVARVLQIDDVTAGDSQHGVIARYRGRLVSEDSQAAYDQLSAALASHGVLPLFRMEPDGRHVILLTPRPPEPKPARISVNVILFVLTVLSVMLAGVVPGEDFPANQFQQILYLLRNILTGWPFAVSLLGILLAHEFGHYLMSRHHKTPATLPYFIPFPFTAIGTLGAAILMQGTPKNKRILFDIGVAGPLAGVLVAIPVLWLGLSLSHLDVISDRVYPAVAEGGDMFCDRREADFKPDGSYTCPIDNLLEGNSLFYLGIKYLRFGQLLPSPEAYDDSGPVLYWLNYFFTGRPLPMGGLDVMIHPVAFAGWVGLLVTALNLLPAGTLDGGHLVYGLFGEKAGKAFPVILVLLGILGFFWNGWWLWALLLVWLGRVHAQPLDQITPLDPARKALALVMLVIFVLVFSPVPFVVF